MKTQHRWLVFCLCLLLFIGSASAQEAWVLSGTVGYGSVYDVVWRPNSHEFVVASETGVRLYQIEDSEPVQLTSDRTSELAWSADGYRLAMATDTGITILEWQNDTDFGVMAHLSDAQAPLAWSPSEKQLAFSTAEAHVGIWEIATGNSRIVFKEHDKTDDDRFPDKVADLLWVSETEVVSLGYEDNLVYVWEIASATVLYQLDFRAKTSVLLPASASDLFRVVIADGGELSIYTFKEDFTYELRQVELDVLRVNHISQSVDYKTLAGVLSNRTVLLLDTATLTLLAAHHPYREEDAISYPYARELEGDSAWSTDGQYLVTASIGHVYLWKRENTQLELLEEKIGYGSWLNAMDWSSDSTQIATGHGFIDDFYTDDSAIRVWDVQKKHLVWQAEELLLQVVLLDWHPTRNWIATGHIWDDRYLRIWDAAMGEFIDSESNITTPYGMQWRPQHDQLVIVNGRVGIWTWGVSYPDAIDGIVIPYPDIYIFYPETLAWHPDGTALVSSGHPDAPDAVAVWNIENGSIRVVLEQTAEFQPIGDNLAFSPDRRWIAASVESAETESIGIFDAETGKLQHMIDFMGKLDWSPDSQFLVIGGNDGTAQLWDVQAAKKVMTLIENAGVITDVAWSPNGEYIAVATQRGVVYLFSQE